MTEKFQADAWLTKGVRSPSSAGFQEKALEGRERTDEVSRATRVLASQGILGEQNAAFGIRVIEVIERKQVEWLRRHEGRFRVIEIHFPHKIRGRKWVAYVAIAGNKFCVVMIGSFLDLIEREQLRDVAVARSCSWVLHCPKSKDHGPALLVDLEGKQIRRIR